MITAPPHVRKLAMKTSEGSKSDRRSQTLAPRTLMPPGESQWNCSLRFIFKMERNRRPTWMIWCLRENPNRHESLMNQFLLSWVISPTPTSKFHRNLFTASSVILQSNGLVQWTFYLSKTAFSTFSTQPGHPSVGRRNEYQQELKRKQTHCAMNWPHIRGLAVSAGVWLRALGNGDPRRRMHRH